MPARHNPSGFRKINLPPNRPRRLDGLFWWLAGIALAVVFWACVAMAFKAHQVRHF